MYASLWMLLPGFAAMNGCCGGAATSTGFGVAGAPTYAGDCDGRGSWGMGTADAAPAPTHRAPASRAFVTMRRVVMMVGQRPRSAKGYVLRAGPPVPWGAAGAVRRSACGTPGSA